MEIDDALINLLDQSLKAKEEIGQGYRIKKKDREENDKYKEYILKIVNKLLKNQNNSGWIYNVLTTCNTAIQCLTEYLNDLNLKEDFKKIKEIIIPKEKILPNKEIELPKVKVEEIDNQEDIYEGEIIKKTYKLNEESIEEIKKLLTEIKEKINNSFKKI